MGVLDRQGFFTIWGTMATMFAWVPMVKIMITSNYWVFDLSEEFFCNQVCEPQARVAHG